MTGLFRELELELDFGGVMQVRYMNEKFKPRFVAVDDTVFEWRA